VEVLQNGFLRSELWRGRYRATAVKIFNGRVASENPRVVGSIPTLATILHATFKGFILDCWSASLSRAIAASWSSCSPVQKP